MLEKVRQKCKLLMATLIVDVIKPGSDIRSVCTPRGESC